MVSREQVECAVRIHGHAYRFIRWLSDVRYNNTLRFDERHHAMNEFDAAERWFCRNADLIPDGLCPAERDRASFINMVVSFGMTTGGYADGESKPHWTGDFKVQCTCRFCSCLVWRLGWRSYGRAGKRDRQGVKLLKLAALRDLAESMGLPLIESDLVSLLDAELGCDDDLVMWTYGFELVRRCRFDRNRLAYERVGRAVLTIWWEIARNKDGRVPRNFELDADRMMLSRDRVGEVMKSHVAAQMAVEPGPDGESR